MFVGLGFLVSLAIVQAETKAPILLSHTDHGDLARKVPIFLSYTDHGAGLGHLVKEGSYPSLLHRPWGWPRASCEGGLPSYSLTQTMGQV